MIDISFIPKRFLFFSAIITLLLSLGLLCLALIGKDDNLLRLGFVFGILALFSGAALFIRTGKFIYTRYFRIAQGVSTLVFVGALFKIMHWPLADILLGTGFSAICISYLLYMIMEKRMHWTNWVKLFLMIAAFGSRYFKMMHWGYEYELLLVAIALLSALMSDFVRNRRHLVWD